MSDRLTSYDFHVFSMFMQYGHRHDIGTVNECVEYTTHESGIDLEDPKVIESIQKLRDAFCLYIHKGGYEHPNWIVIDWRCYANYEKRLAQGY